MQCRDSAKLLFWVLCALGSCSHFPGLLCPGSECSKPSFQEHVAFTAMPSDSGWIRPAAPRGFRGNLDDRICPGFLGGWEPSQTRIVQNIASTEEVYSKISHFKQLNTTIKQVLLSPKTPAGSSVVQGTARWPPCLWHWKASHQIITLTQFSPCCQPQV